MSDEQPAPVKTAAETAHATKIETAIEHWFNTHIADSPVARAVDAYNHLRSVLGHLSADIADIAKEV
jgi:hypothetical protein